MRFPQWLQPDIFTVFGFGIKWYSLAYIIGILAGWALGRFWARRSGRMTVSQVDDLVFWAAIGIIAGGRLGYILLYQPAVLLENPLYIVTGIRDGGMSFHGGFFGVVIAVLLFCRKHKLPFLGIMDLAALVTPIGLLLGRLANFINMELYGKEVQGFPGVQFGQRTVEGDLFYNWKGAGNSAELLSYDAGSAQGLEPLLNHPSQLYEAFLEGLVLFVILNVGARFFGFLKYKSLCAGIFALGYGLARFLVEFVRLPDAQIGYLFSNWLTLGQVYSLPLIGIGLWLLATYKSRPIGPS